MVLWTSDDASSPLYPYFSLYIKASQFTMDPGNVQPDFSPPEVTTNTAGTFPAIVWTPLICSGIYIHCLVGSSFWFRDLYSGFWFCLQCLAWWLSKVDSLPLGPPSFPRPWLKPMTRAFFSFLHSGSIPLLVPGPAAGAILLPAQ